MLGSIFNDPRYSSLLVLLIFLGTLVLLGVLYQVGALGWLIQVVFAGMRGAVRGGFAVWRRYLSWMSWPLVLVAVAVGHLLLATGLGHLPLLVILIGATLLTLGVVTCLAYVFIDSERDEVERGYKVLHDPTKGQQVAENLVRYGPTASFPLLVSAALAYVSGFALLNLGLYQAVDVGSGGAVSWYSYSTDHSRAQPSRRFSLFGRPLAYPTDYSDFLAYTLIQLTNVVDLIDLTNRMSATEGPRVAFVRPVAWPASTLLVSFKTFFTLVLLQQIFAAIRRARALNEAVRDFWSPYEPIHKRAVENLRQQGGWAAEQLLQALESVTPLTAEQRALLPQLLAGMGPTTVPVLERHLRHANPEVRAASVAALGRLEAWRSVAQMVPLADDSEEEVRLGLAEALGRICMPGAGAVRKRWSLRRDGKPGRSWLARLPGLRRGDAPVERRDPIELCMEALRKLLRDDSRAVRIRAAESVAAAGPAAAAATPELLLLTRDEDAEARAAAAKALGVVKGPVRATLQALLPLLEEPTPTVLVPAACALGALGKDAAPAVPALIGLVQHADETVRTAAAEAIGGIGKLDRALVPELVAGLKDEDSQVRTRAAEALGTIGAPAAMTAPDLVMALKDDNDRVRARVVWALGQLGPEPASLTVPALRHSLEDPDSRVAALAAEALGSLGEAALSAAPALLEATGHINPEVRRGAAEAASRLGLEDEAAVACYQRLAGDEQGPVRRQAVLCLGVIRRVDAGIDGALAAALEDPDPQVRAGAVLGMGKRLGANPALLDLLLRATQDADETVRVEAASALGQAEEVSVTTVEHLGALLGDDSEAVQSAAAAALGKLGPRAESATEALHELLRTGTADLREHALRALVHIMPPQALEAFTTAMHDAEASIRRLASAGLMKLKGVPLETVPLLLEGLKDADVQVRSNVAYVCGQLAELPSELVQPLLDSTGDPDDGLRLNAVRALQNVPMAGTEEALTPLLQDPNPQVGLLAARALLAKDPGRADAWEIVAAALGNGTGYLREQAVGVIEACAASPVVVTALLHRLPPEEGDGMRRRLEAVVLRLEDAARAAAETAQAEAPPAVAPP